MICRYAVYLIDSSFEDRWSYILGMNRVCVNAKKLMLLAVVDPVCELKFDYIEMKRWLPEANRE
jgi:tRNA splicing endonuclease